MQLENGTVKTVIYTCDRKENYLKSTLEHLLKADIEDVIISNNVEHQVGQAGNMSDARDAGVLDKFNSIYYNEVTTKKGDDVRLRAQKNYVNALASSTLRMSYMKYSSVYPTTVRLHNHFQYYNQSYDAV